MAPHYNTFRDSIRSRLVDVCSSIVLAIIVMVIMEIIKVVLGYSTVDKKKVKAEKTGEFVGNGIKQGGGAVKRFGKGTKMGISEKKK